MRIASNDSLREITLIPARFAGNHVLAQQSDGWPDVVLRKVRGGPRTGVIPNGTVVVVLKKDGEDSQVFDTKSGFSGWLKSSNLVGTVPAASTGARMVVQQRDGWSNIVVREKPGGTKMGKISNGTIVIVLL